MDKIMSIKTIMKNNFHRIFSALFMNFYYFCFKSFLAMFAIKCLSLIWLLPVKIDSVTA